MNLFRFDSPLEQKLQKVEALLQELNLRIEFTGYQMDIIDGNGGGAGFVMDIENRDNSRSLPRFVESERLVANA